MSEWHAHGYEEVINDFEDINEINSGQKRFRNEGNAIDPIASDSSSDSGI